MNATAFRFQAMGGVVELQCADRTDADREITELFERYERTLSRFLPWSELSALNRAGGRPFRASPLLFDAVAAALDWARVTGGVFDPTVINILEATGYDRTFEEIGARASVTARCAVRAHRAGWRAMRLDRASRTIALPAGTRVDLGGIGKGYTVDRAIEALGRGANTMVNASGDLYAAGSGPDGDSWQIGVQDPFDAEHDVAVLRVRDRGVATSGRVRRSWCAAGARYHHLIDPRAGTCSDSGLASVTVVARTTTAADVLAKTAFLLGAEAGLAFVERARAAGLAITDDGDVRMTEGMEEYLV